MDCQVQFVATEVLALGNWENKGQVCISIGNEKEVIESVFADYKSVKS
jgi:hypothetical protein